ncbi:MAG: hypothetical protein AAGD10_04395 [Myxococcota bacterium]
MIAALVLASVLGQTDTASAAEANSPPWRLWAELSTDIPLHVGARIEAEFPHRIRAWTSLGVVPSAYVELIDAVSQEIGDYNDETSQVIVDTLQSSLIWRLHAGWRPFRRYDWSIDAGYMLATLGGATNGAALLGAALGQAVPLGGSTEFDVASTLHLLGFEISHRWEWKNGLAVRVGLGFVTTVEASNSVEPRGDEPRARLSRAFADDLEDYLDEVYTSFVHTPYVGVGVGYDLLRFFRPRTSD